MYHDGEGVQQNYSKAIEYYTKAAYQGGIKAQFKLAVMYHTGQGTTKNYSKAIEFYTKAADKGYAPAQ